MNKTFSVVVTFLAVLGFSACGGGATNSATGTTGFTPASAVAFWSSTADGGTDPTVVSVLLTTMSQDALCKTLDHVAGSGVVSQDLSGLGLSIFSSGAFGGTGDITAGNYPIYDAATRSAIVNATTNPVVDAGVMFTRFNNFADGGAVLLNADQSGTVTLSQVTLGTVFPDGGSTGGEVKGTYSATVVLDGGSSGTLTGSFDATGCKR